MNRRDFLVTTGALSVAAIWNPELVHAVEEQDLEYLRALERAQQDRPRALSSRARIAPSGEPGTPLVVHGRVFRQDGRTSARGVIVFAYHTDRTGLYADRSAGPHVWRLRGWAQTDAEGRFQFDSIRPAPYPNRSQAAHIHFALYGPGVPQHFSAGLVFDDDPLVTAEERQKSARDGIFSSVCVVERREGVEHVNLTIRVTE